MTVENSASINPPKQITLAALIKPTGYYQGPCHSNRILSKGYTDAWPGRYMLGYDDMAFWSYQGCNENVREDKENFYGAYGNGQATASGVNDLSGYIKTDKWYTLIYTYDGQYSRISVNGTKSTVLKTTTFTSHDRQLFMGRHEDPNFPYYFTVIIDEIRIYNKALTLPEVQQLNQTLQSNQ